MISKVLNDSQIERIHQTSLSILEEVGVHVPHKEMLEKFVDAGALVDLDAQLVRIPRDLVTRMIGLATKTFTIYGRDTARTAAFGLGKRNFNGTAGQASWIEEIGGPRRYACMNDVAEASRFSDSLEYINIVGAMADPHDVPVSYRCVEVMASMLKNTTKPLHFWFYDRASAKYLVDMMIALRGTVERATEFPVCYAFLEPISPLRFPFDGIDLLFETARLNLPVSIGPMAQMGLSGPASIAGTLAQENAEILAGVCITQLIKPGAPLCYGGVCHAFDMRTTQLIFGGPEQAIFGVAMTQMGKHYGFPVYINVGLTDSKRPDAQAGLEAGVTLAQGAAAGADIFGHFGICGVDQGASLDILVLQDEIISYVKSTVREIEFSDESLGLAEVAQVGPGGNFIDTDFTLDHFRRELWFPKLLDRSYYQSWLDGGATSLEDRCRDRKNEILRTHEPEPIDPKLSTDFDEIVSDARHHLCG